MMDASFRKLIAIVSVLVFASVAVIPAADASVDAELPEPAGLSYSDDPEYGFPWLVALFVIGWMGTAAGAAYVAADLLGEASSDEDNAGDQEAVNQAFRKTESTKLTFAAETARNLISTVLPADVELWFFTSDYWQKMIEYVVCDTWYQDNNGYDEVMNDSLYGSGLLTNAANYMYSWSAAIDNAYNSILRYYAGEVSPNDYSQGMEVYLDYGSGRFAVEGSGATGSTLTIDTVQIAKPGSEGTCVYIDTDPRDFQDEPYCHTLYVFGDSGATLWFMGPSGTVAEGTTYTLSKGANDIDALDMPSGVYSLEAGLTYVGNIVPLSTDNAANVYGGMVVSQESGLSYLMPSSDDGALTLRDGDDDVIDGGISEFGLTVEFDGPDGRETTSSVILGTVSERSCDIIGLYDDLVQQITAVAYNAHVAGRAAWEVFDIAEESNPFIKPSSVVPNIPGVQMTSTDIAGTYVAAMRQILDYGLGNTEDFDGWVTNVENVGLYVYGDIYRDGKVWAENVVFTPYITTADQHLQVGTNTWGGDGFGMVWAQVADYDDWSGQASASQYMITDLEKGDVIVIERMVKHGEPITEIDLSRAEIQKWNSGGSESEGTDDEDIAVLDAQVMMLFLIVELGLILILIGVVTGFTPLFFVGTAVMVVGVVWPQVFTSLLLGDFTWADLMPFGWV